MRTLGRRLLTLLMIALMAIPAVSPPVLWHSHTDGDTSHRHNAATAVGCRHSHAHGATYSYSPRHDHRSGTTAKHTHQDSATRSAAFPVSHAHLFWLSFEWSLPIPASDRSDSDRLFANVEQWVPLVSESVLPDAQQDGAYIVAADRALPEELEPRLVACSVERPPNEPIVACLCDIARRERSGVLVI